VLLLSLALILLAGNCTLGNMRGLDDPETALLSVALDLVLEFKPDYVLFENVPSALKQGQVQLIRNRLGREYNIDWLNMAASSLGFQHARNRLWILASKRGTPFRIPQLPCDCLNSLTGSELGAEPPRCVLSKPEGWSEMMDALGCSVVPAVALLAAARLSGQDGVLVPSAFPRDPLVFDASVYKQCGRRRRNKCRKHEVLTDVECRLLWATPRASVKGAYANLTCRGLWDLGSQLRFEQSTLDREGSASPLWVAWLMGYPPNYILL
jgi:hypothetical protein